MELKHLQALLGIADTGSFSAAATSIGTVQSNVSAHVARLERELDVQLVDRASGGLTGVRPRRAGRSKRRNRRGSKIRCHVRSDSICPI